MFKKVAPYVGEYKKYTVWAAIMMTIGIVANVLPYFFLYQIITPEFLERFPEGIMTQAGDGGKQLSGGERQRISLARAILKNAPIIVLDEATAFMDPENEDKMNAALDEIMKDKTVLVIAHRLKTIKDADQILVIKDGQIVESGNHSQLMNRNGMYAHMVQLQG